MPKTLTALAAMAKIAASEKASTESLAPIAPIKVAVIGEVPIIPRRSVCGAVGRDLAGTIHGAQGARGKLTVF
jgi:hypothetical protein